jgi:hypothetical protein
VPIFDENNVNVVTGVITKTEFHMLNDPLNYSVITLMPSKMIQIPAKLLLTMMQDSNLRDFKESLSDVISDPSMREKFIA